MEHKSNENIAAALELLEEAARQKKDELRTLMSDKCTNLRSLIMENESSLAESLTTAKDHVLDAAMDEKTWMEKSGVTDMLEEAIGPSSKDSRHGL
jgi:CHASE3 domain sensor protein